MPENRPKVSVVVPCLNRETTVEEAVRSVLSQDYEDIEVIAVDDNSTDRTMNILESIDDPRLIVVRSNDLRGQSRAANFGIGMARGEWIAFQDSDDIWKAGKLSKQMHALESSDYIAAYCSMAVTDLGNPGNDPLEIIPGRGIEHRHGNILPSLVFKNFSSTQTLVIRHDILLEAGSWDVKFSALNDWDLMLRIAQKGSVCHIEDILVEQRISPDSVTNSIQKRLEAFYMILEKHGELIQEYPKAIAFHFHRIAGTHRALGDPKQAFSASLYAVRKDPMNLRYAIAALRHLALAATKNAAPRHFHP